MVPFWDLLNHVSGATNVRLNHCVKRIGGGVLQMIATRDIEAGEEVVSTLVWGLGRVGEGGGGRQQVGLRGLGHPLLG
jgi:hypothetical protein